MSWIIDEIEVRNGALNFRDFMELALYHPRHGFYSLGRPRYGRHGDFLTAPSASPWYGRILANVLCRAVEVAGPVVFVDVASGDGSLISTVLSELPPHALDEVEVVSVEHSPSMRAIQQKRLREVGVPIRLAASIGEIDRFTGPVVLHASELYDAMPVHRVIQRGMTLREFFVTTDRGGLGWLEGEADSRLPRYFQNHDVALANDQIAEVNLQAQEFHARLLELASGGGLALVLDYGYPAARLYNPRGRSGGSLTAYREHRIVNDPLADPGRQDLTAHINWDDLRRSADGADWREIGLWPLAEFLVRGGLAEVVEREGLGIEADLDAHTVTERQEIKRLLDPDGMGSDLKMLIQGRDALAGIAEDLFAAMP